jgi:Putative polyhydroxyalkanoic acid system protein (PHA_gran_rgn)
MDPIVVNLPHGHGRAEAVRRVKAAIEEARARYPAELKVAEENWDGDRLRFRVALLGQSVTGSIDVADDQVRAEVLLTWLMGHLVQPAEALIRQEGERALSGS